MSSVSWLKAYNGADTRQSIFGQKEGVWQQMPSLSCYRLDTGCLQRAATMNGAVRWNADWHFEQQDKGAFTLCIDSSLSAKNGLVIALGSDMADAFGFYVKLCPRGATVFRRVIGEYSPVDPQSYWKETLAPAQGEIRAARAPLQKSGRLTFTVVYDHGTFLIYEGDAPGRGKLIVEYKNKAPGLGNYRWGVGLYGQPNGDKLSIVGVKKWISA